MAVVAAGARRNGGGDGGDLDRHLGCQVQGDVRDAGEQSPRGGSMDVVSYDTRVSAAAVEHFDEGRHDEELNEDERRPEDGVTGEKPARIAVHAGARRHASGR